MRRLIPLFTLILSFSSTLAWGGQDSDGKLAPRPAEAAGNKPTSDEIELSPGAGQSSLAALGDALSRLDHIDGALLTLALPEGKALTPAAAEQLLKLLRERVAPRVRGAMLGAAEPQTGEEARRLARSRRRPLVHLSTRLVGPQLQLDLELRSWPRSVWAQAIKPKGERLQAKRYLVPIDSEVRRLLPTPQALFQSVHRTRLPLADPLSLACTASSATLLHVGVVGRRGIALTSLPLDAPERVSTSAWHTQQWSALSPISAHPLRAPLGSARFVEAGLWVSSSDRSASALLGPQGKLKGKGRQSYFRRDGACSAFTSTGFAQTPESCPAPTGASAEARPRREPSFRALAASSTVDPAGLVTKASIHHAAGALLPRLLVATEGSAPIDLALEGAGSALALGDIEGDGSLEVIFSRSNEDSGRDALELKRLERRQLRPVTSLEGGEVHAITICPFSGTNPRVVLAAVDGELWVIR